MKKEKELYLAPEVAVEHLCMQAFVCTSQTGGIMSSTEEEDDNEWPYIN